MEFILPLRFSLLIITVAINVLLALLVYQNNPKAATNRVYSLLSLVITVWLLVNYISVEPQLLETSLIWIRLSIFFATPLSTLFFVLAHTLPSHQLKLSRNQLTVTIAVTLLVMVITISPFAFTGVEIVGNSPRPIPGPGIILFAFVTTMFSLMAVYTLIKKFRFAKGLEREQIRYIMLGTLLMLGLIITTVLLPAILSQSSIFVPLIPLYTLIFLGLTAYVILRHRFLDMRLIVARTVAYFLLIGVIGAFYSISLFIIGASIFGTLTGPLNIFLNGAITLIVVLTFRYVQRLIEKWTDRLFFKGYYDSQELLKSLTYVMSTTLELSNLTNLILNKLLTEMRITRGVFVLLGKELMSIEFVEQQGYSISPKFQPGDINRFLISPTAIFYDYLDEGDLKQLMRAYNLSAVLPLVVKDNKIGVLALGEKASGQIYSQQDTDLLDILASAISIAIQNSKEYEEIKRFNITLREEVDRATRQLRVVNAKLQELDQLKDDFVSVASHELRTPMTAIRSYSWMALNKSDIPLSEKMKRYLSRTLISTERLINLVNEMLNISRIESGRIEIRPEIFNIAVLVRDVFEEVSVKASEKHLKLKLGDTRDIPNVFADQGKVHQVLLNLIGNALKFTPENGDIEVNFAANQTVVGVAIKDNGVGISKQDMAKLFKKFGRLNNSYTTAGTSGGTGLGLYVCKSLIQLMGGEIWVQSEGMGKGSTFYFTLPRATKDVLANVEKYQLKPEGEAKILEPVAI